MRKFRFRMWLKEEDYPSLEEINEKNGHPPFKTRMEYHFHLSTWGYPMKFEENWDGNIYYKKAIVMQYTGLRDKNNKNIYEGDILLGRFDINKVEDHIFLSLSKEERKNGSKIYKVDDLIDFYRAYIPFDNIEVIGNIYENPELLKDV